MKYEIEAEYPEEEIFGDVENTLNVGHAAPAGEKEVDEDDVVKSLWIIEEEEEMVGQEEVVKSKNIFSKEISDSGENKAEEVDDDVMKQVGDRSFKRVKMREIVSSCRTNKGIKKNIEWEDNSGDTSEKRKNSKLC